VKLLSERLLAFRDSEGRLGLIDEFCAHRGVSLWFGRNEEAGLRCPYHGWKYDVTGQCIEVPSEPEESGFCQRVKLKSYPLVERGGVLWTYMGEPEKQPPLPEWEFATVPPRHRYISKRTQESNWLQALEGGIDSSHVSFLHRGDLNTDPLFKGAKGNQYNMADSRPVFEVVESAGGLYIGARRNAENDQYYWRITQWVMPSFTMIAPRGTHSVHGHFWVPIDDENCWTWSFDYHPIRELTDAEVAAMKDGKSIYVKFVPGTWRPRANKDNDYLIDRAAQKAGRTYSGVEGIAMQDASLQESMGPIVDRTKENLVSTDNGIIMARHRLLRSVKALNDKGEIPPGVDPAHQKVRSAAVVLPRDKAFKDAAKDALVARPGVAPASV
jgi:phthalate 4,5-dioxygenase